jgi:hypothetical protein
MKTYENARIRVTLTDEQSANFDDCRATILSHAMRILGNRSEVNILENEQPEEREIRNEAFDILKHEHLQEHCHYNYGELLMRMMGGHRMSDGMHRDIENANIYASEMLERNPAPYLERAKQSLADRQQLELRYRHRFADQNWDIQIIGDMPEQIGMCRYQEVVA